MTPHETEYIGADHLPSRVFRLQLCGGPYIRIKSARDDSNQVVIAIADSRPGIDPQVIGKVFEPFYTTKSQGIGMGLAISRSIIEAHGGRIWAEPTIPHGATFQCALPGGIESVQ